MEKIITDAAIEYLHTVSKTRYYSPDLRNLRFEHSIALENVVKLKKLHENYENKRINHFVIYRISLKKIPPKYMSSDMLYGNPFEGLFSFSHKWLTPKQEPFSRPYLDRKVRIGVVYNHYSSIPGARSRTLNRRISEYTWAVTNPQNPGYNTPLSKDIRTMVGLKDGESDKNVINLARKKVRTLLKVDIIHVSKDSLEASAAERFFIYFFNARNVEYGYNTKIGGIEAARDILGMEAMEIMRKKGLTWWDIDSAMRDSIITKDPVEVVAQRLGLDYGKEFLKIIKFYYSNLDIWEENGKLYNIKDYFPGYEGRIRKVSFRSVQHLYRGIVILTAFRNGIWDRDSVLAELNYRGLNQPLTTLDRICIRIFQKKFYQVRNDAVIDILYPEISKIPIRRKTTISQLARLIPNMDEKLLSQILDSKYGEYTKDHKYGGFENYLDILKKDMLIPLMMMNFPPSQSLRLLGYPESSSSKPGALFRRIFKWKLENIKGSEKVSLPTALAYLFFTGNVLTSKGQMRIFIDKVKDLLEGFYDEDVIRGLHALLADDDSLQDL